MNKLRFIETKVFSKSFFNSKYLLKFHLGTAQRVLTIIRLHLTSLNRSAKILLNHLPPQAFIPLAYHCIIFCYPCCQWNLKVCIYFFQTKAKWIEIKTIIKMWKITPNFIRKFLNFGSLRIMLAQSLFWAGSLATQTLTVIRQGCSVKTASTKNLVSTLHF